eukprot:7086868-Lingulodinium_polyedra.AAC.1
MRARTTARRKHRRATGGDRVETRPTNTHRTSLPSARAAAFANYSNTTRHPRADTPCLTP